MAGYCENREQNLENKYLCKVLGDVDKRVVLPASLRGDALRPKLDDVKCAAPKGKIHFVFPKGWFTLSSGITYAAAFLLIVGLFYGMGFNRQNDLVNGEIALVEENSPDFDAQQDTLTFDDPPMLMTASLPEEENPVTGGAASEESAVSESAANSEIAPFALQQPESEPEEEAVFPIDADMGVGGGGKSTRLGMYENYLLAYRPNDYTDPDHEDEAPHVLELLDAAGDHLISQIDIPSMTEIDQCLVLDSTVVVVGGRGDAVLTFSINLDNLEEPVGLKLLEQPGTLKSARIYKDVLHVISYSEETESLACEQVSLPDSTEDGACIITALNLTEDDYNQVAFLGAGEDIKIYNLNAYLYYDCLQEEDDSEAIVEEEDKFNIAQVRLSGLSIELSGVSEQ